MKAQIQHLQDRLVVATIEARSNPRLRPVAEAIRGVLERVISGRHAAGEVL
jgi:hypothetical protein